LERDFGRVAGHRLRPGYRLVALLAVGFALAAMPVTAGSAPSGVLTGHFRAVAAGVVPSGISSYNDATCPGDQLCLVAGGSNGRGVITRTQDGGARWQTVVVPDSVGLEAISCATEQVCFAGGSSANGSNPQMFVSRDSGRSWKQEAVPSSAMIGSIACPTPSDCLVVGYQSGPFRSSLIATSDGGASWTVLTPPYPVLATVRCVDLSHCWVSGAGAFFTSNLGRSWLAESPPDYGAGSGSGGIAIYSETVDIEFQSPTDGWVVGGDQCGGAGVTQCPGAAFHTTDGGRSWVLSTSSRRLAFGWQINCQGVSCLMVTQSFSSSSVVTTTNDGDSWTTTQVLPGAINALACTPHHGFCLLAGNSAGSAQLLTVGAAALGNSKGGGPLTMSTISSALISPGRAFASPEADLLAALVTIFAVVLITFPSQLFNYTFQANYEDIRSSWERRIKPMRKLREKLERGTERSRDIWLFTLVLLLGSILDGFLDPSFGLTSSSGLTVLSMVLAILVSVAVPTFVSHTYRRLRHRPTELRLQALPVGLLIALVCVVISRAVGFQPGYLYGLIVGVAYGRHLAVHEEGHVAALCAIASLSVAVLAWVAWVPVHSLATAASPSPILLLASDVLASVIVGGLVGNLVGLLPLHFLQGGDPGPVAQGHVGRGVQPGRIRLHPSAAAARDRGLPAWRGATRGRGGAFRRLWGGFGCLLGLLRAPKATQRGCRGPSPADAGSTPGLIANLRAALRQTEADTHLPPSAEVSPSDGES